jgi:hypothetical protein
MSAFLFNQPSFVTRHRKSCLKHSGYSFSTTATLPTDTALPPICIADKPKHCKQITNAFVDDRGFPNESEYYDSLLHNINGGPILCKIKHPPPSFDEADPAFFCAYNKSTHGVQPRKIFDFSHLDPNVHDKVYTLIQKYWSVFDEKGVLIPVKN